MNAVPGPRRAAVIGSGGCGVAVAHRLAASGLFDSIVLTARDGDRARGRALDIAHAGVIEGFTTTVTGIGASTDPREFQAIEGSEVVVIAAGQTRRPGMRREDLTGANLAVVAAAAAAVRMFASDAIAIVLTNPLDEMTALCHAVSGLPVAQVIGQAGVLDSARLRYAVAERLRVPVAAVEAVTLGPHSEEMVPVLSGCRVRGQALSELVSQTVLAELGARARHGGGEVIDLLRIGSTSVAPSAAVLSMVRALRSGERTRLPVCTLLNGEYGIDGVFLGTSAILDGRGVVRVVEHELSPAEALQLRAAAESARARQSKLLASVPAESCNSL